MEEQEDEKYHNNEEDVEARFLGKDSIVSDVWYYCYAYVVYVVHVSSGMIVCMQYCAYVVCTCCLCNIMYRVLVQIVLYECCIFSVGYIWCYVHVGYTVLCTYCNVCMMDMRCYMHMVFCACWICNLCTDDAMYMLDMQRYVHVVLCGVVHVVLCTYGVVCMIVQAVLCACGAMYMLYKWRYVQGVMYICHACDAV